MSVSPIEHFGKQVLNEFDELGWEICRLELGTRPTASTLLDRPRSKI
jgi:hypothetical protein